MPTARKERNKCLFCETECERPAYRYCSNKCQLLHRQSTKIEQGIASIRTWKNYLVRTEGHRCSVCQLASWNEQPIPLDIDHLDGNVDNNVRENLRLICPNCHAQTSTYKGKNAGNGRYYRRVRHQTAKLC